MDVRKENSHLAPDVKLKQGSKNGTQIISLKRSPVSFREYTLLPHIKINESVSSVQVLKFSLEKIELLLRSVRGISEQLETEATPQRKKALEDELKEVVRAVKEVRDTTSVISIEDLRKKALSNLPEELNRIPESLTSLEEVVRENKLAQRMNSIEASEKELFDLKNAVEEVELSLRVLFTYSETAIENQIAVKSTLRDLEAAVIETRKVTEFILAHPQRCMKVLGKDLQDVILTSLL